MIVVLGGGPAGRIAAVHLALNGEEVTLVEKGEIGGQCLHYGCMMVCALNDAARARTAARNLHDLGIFASVPEIRFTPLLSRMKEVQGKIAGILDKETREAGVSIIYGQEGRLENGRAFVGENEIPADAVIVATGSRPNIPAVPGVGLQGVITPHTLPDMGELPRNLIIIGGGIMAAEFAYIFQEFGSEVQLISRSGFLKTLDPRLAALARNELSGTEIHEDAALIGIRGGTRVEGVEIEGEDGRKEISCDAVLIAAGLTARSEMVQGVDKKPGGEIIVDRKMRTSAAGVYACGDVTGSPRLTPVARAEGIVAAENILGREREMDYSAIPQSMNLFQEYAFVEIDNPCAVSAMLPGPAGPGTFWSVPSGRTGFARVSADPDTGTLCGMYTAAPSGGIIAAYQAFLIRQGTGIAAFDDFLEVHPMADGVYPLIKYLAGRFRNEKRS
ncbi:MAG: NAD(P)/FAD-dependent oxidoreductase [Methanomicrobiales archaeon]|nr:NAD(P)/FAD-dependent oxidoreductase [Methanomicrobiales archaeon]NYT20291.1 NAD(P)/FAD-dependent oxidoreductase [Methanomicrobiales archaeon]